MTGGKKRRYHKTKGISRKQLSLKMREQKKKKIMKNLGSNMNKSLAMAMSMAGGKKRRYGKTNRNSRKKISLKMKTKKKY